MAETNDSKIQQLNAEICELHNSHYKDSPSGLLQPQETPNSNTIYHLYCDGEITYQKGGFAYLLRTEFSLARELYDNFRESPYSFPKKNMNGYSYAILTEKECREMRKKMADYLN
jgi:hypothetical protein